MYNPIKIQYPPRPSLIYIHSIEPYPQCIAMSPFVSEHERGPRGAGHQAGEPQAGPPAPLDQVRG